MMQTVSMMTAAVGGIIECGDGNLNPNEEDDRNRVGGDGCDEAAANEVCGMVKYRQEKTATTAVKASLVT